MNKASVLIIWILILSSCSISPGMHFETKTKKNKDYVFIDSLNKDVEVKNINFQNKSKIPAYEIGNGDQISVTIWGIPTVFPVTNVNPDQNLRRVDSNGNIYFPYAGLIKAWQKTQDELRDELTLKISKYFNDPQLDLSIAKFNSQKVYLLGEVTRALKINITDIPLSLSEALGEAKGLSTNTSNASEIIIIRQPDILGQDPEIFIADLSSPAGFIDAGNFYLNDNDIVYVNSNGTTRWNRVISQFFPFSSFLTSIDRLTN